MMLLPQREGSHPVPRPFLDFAERIRFREELRRTDAVLQGKRFISLMGIFAIALILVGSSFVLAEIFLFSQNLPSSNVTASIMGCSGIAGATEDLIVDLERGGTGLTFVCPTGADGVTQHYAVQPLNAGSAHWHHSADIGGYNALYLIPSQTIPVQGCHVVRFPDGSLSNEWALNMSSADGTVTFFDGQQAYAYCAEYVRLGAYGPISVSWNQ